MLFLTPIKTQIKNIVFKKMNKILIIIGTISFLFITSCTSYKKKDNKVFWTYYKTFSFEKQYKEVKNADYKTFEKIKGSYGKDKNYVFFKSSLINNADPKTFEVIDERFSKDKNNVFNEIYLINNADPKTFLVFDKTLFSKDKNNVFYGIGIIKNADAKTFREVKKNRWYVDKNNVFRKYEKVENTNSDGFKVINGHWQDSWAKNKTHYIYENSIIKGLDYETAEIIKYSNGKLTNYIKDKNNVFFGMTNKIVEGANPKTFRAMEKYSPNFGQDDRYLYDFGEIVKEIKE